MIAILLLLLTLATDSTTGSSNSLLPALDDFIEVYPSLSNSRSDGPSLTPLYFGLMVAPSEDSDYLNTTLTAVQLALDTINADSDLLRGYSLHYTLTVSQVTIPKHAIQFAMTIVVILTLN